MTNTQIANEIMYYACSARGFSVLASGDARDMEIAVQLVARGFLSVSESIVSIPGGPQLYGPDTHDRTETKHTYTATESGRERYTSGTLLA